MLTVEGCLIALQASEKSKRTPNISNSYDRRFIHDLTQYAQQGKAISTAQGDIALKLIERYRHILVASGYNDAEIGMLLITPVFKVAPYKSTILPREVRWAGDNKLVFRCKFNQSVVDDIRKLEGLNHFITSSKPRFDHDNKLWVVTVSSGNYERVMDVIKRHKFQIDTTVEQYFLAVVNSLGQPSSIETEGDGFVITARNDDLLAAWVDLIASTEEADV